MNAEVWVSTLRRGIAHHAIDGRHTVCGRFVGETVPAPNPKYRIASRGYVMDEANAQALHATVPCARCFGTAERHQPRVVPGRGRKGATP